MCQRSTLSTLGVVLVATLLNAVKPVHIDDAAYLTFAEQIVSDPAHPYAFEMFWYDAPQPALDVLAPPVYLYWLAFARWIAPENPVVWHLLVFPWLLVMAVSMNWLAVWFRGKTSPWLIAAFLMSPVVLPGINLMLDVPALALALAALAMFTNSLDRTSTRQALLAGLLLAVAMQTKYTAATMFPVWLGVAWLSRTHRRWHCLTIAVAVALFSVVACESWIAWGHGQSHLLRQLSLKRDGFETPLVVYLGQIALAVPAVTLLGLVRLWRSRGQNHLASLALAALLSVFAMLAFAVYAGTLSVAFAMFIGLSCLLALAAPWLGAEGPGQAFLGWYFLCEVVYCIWVSPFPAMRRVLGPSVPLILLACGAQKPLRETTIRWIACLSIASGLGFWCLDFQAAQLQRQAASVLAEKYADLDGRIWFAGHWGWEFYAKQAGMRPIVSGRSQVRPGDIIVIPRQIACQRFEQPPQARHLETFSLQLSPLLPVTLKRYYGGALQLLPEADQGFVAEIYRVDAPAQIRASRTDAQDGQAKTRVMEFVASPSAK